MQNKQNGGFIMTTAEKFFEKIKDKKVAFIGIGVSHTDVIRQFAEKGIYVEARDRSDRTRTHCPNTMLSNAA